MLPFADFIKVRRCAFRIKQPCIQTFLSANGLAKGLLFSCVPSSCSSLAALGVTCTDSAASEGHTWKGTAEIYSVRAVYAQLAARLISKSHQNHQPSTSSMPAAMSRHPKLHEAQCHKLHLCIQEWSSGTLT